ncbi:MAG: hypothetical protein ACP5KW_06905 [Thermoproteota archaeon]
MTRNSKLKYAWVIFLSLGFSLLILTIFRGLSTEITVIRFGGPGKSKIPISLPPIWPPQKVRIFLQSNGKVDLIILHSLEHDTSLNYSNLIQVKEFRNLENEVVEYEIPQRGVYYIVVRNNEDKNVDGQIILTFYGLEKDLLFLSIVFVCLGVSFLVIWFFGLCSKLRSLSNLHNFQCLLVLN